MRDRVYTALLFNYQVFPFMEVQWSSSQMPSRETLGVLENLGKLDEITAFDRDASDTRDVIAQTLEFNLLTMFLELYVSIVFGDTG